MCHPLVSRRTTGGSSQVRAKVLQHAAPDAASGSATWVLSQLQLQRSLRLQFSPIGGRQAAVTLSIALQAQKTSQ